MISWWGQWLRITGLMFSIIFLIVFSLHAIFVGPLKLSALLATIIASIFSFGMSFYLKRELETSSFEINSSNKDSRKGLQWYYEELESYLLQSRYKEISHNEEGRIFEPPMLSQHMGGKVILKRDAYSITISGPRGVVRIMASVVDVEKIFL